MLAPVSASALIVVVFVCVIIVVGSIGKAVVCAGVVFIVALIAQILLRKDPMAILLLLSAIWLYF